MEKTDLQTLIDQITVAAADAERLRQSAEVGRNARQAMVGLSGTRAEYMTYEMLCFPLVNHLQDAARIATQLRDEMPEEELTMTPVPRPEPTPVHEVG